MEKWENEIARVVSEKEISNVPFIMGIVGVPAIGKTVSARIIKQKIDQVKQIKDYSIDIGMDGFHLYKSELDAMENPDLMHYRRGADFTFNPGKLYEKLLGLKSGSVTDFPSFSHTEGDPVEDSVRIDPIYTKIIILEGLYLFSSKETWKDIRNIFDLKIYIDGDLDSAMERLVERNARCLNFTPEYSRERMENNDRLNAFEVIQTKQYADQIVQFYQKSHGELEGFE